jgi:uncharacterized protein HemX
MVLTPLQSWLLLVILAVGMGFVVYAASRPSWTHRRQHRLHQQHLDELARYERARQRLAHLQKTNPGYVRIHPTKPRKAEDER